MRTDVIFNTDAASGLGRLPDNSIDCIVTSPPYWQLRDYGLSPILFGGQQDCEHDFDDYAICRSCGGWLGSWGKNPPARCSWSISWASSTSAAAY